MILAAGLGTRFRPATYDLPKPLVPLCNEPLIGYAIRNLVASGIREIAINLHHLPDELQRGVVERYGGEASFEFSLEPDILGTGGGIRKLRPWLERDEMFVVLNGDTVQRPPLDRLAARQRESNAVATLVLRQPPANDRFTKVWYDEGTITGFGEGRGEALMFSGCHALSRRVFDLLPAQEFSGITEDVYLPLARREPGALAAIVDDGFWFDIGTPLRYRTASDAMRARLVEGMSPEPGSRVVATNVVSATADVRGDVFESVVGEHCVVAHGATVAGSVLWDGVSVEADANVIRSVVGRRVTVPRGAVVENALVCRRVEGIEYPEGTILSGAVAAVAIDPALPVRLERF